MARISGRILKSDDVKLGGQFHLDPARGASAGGGPQNSSNVLAAPQVRVLENHPEYAVIELTCTCGTSTRLRCEYAGVPASGDAEAENSAIEVSNKTE
jgi:hypothetical protein